MKRISFISVLLGALLACTPYEALDRNYSNSEYPNPFCACSSISFEMNKADSAMGILYDIDGNLLDTLFHGFFEKGTNRIPPMTDSLDSGIYIYRFITNDTTITKKMTLIR